jgi:hypothetical protein
MHGITHLKFGQAQQAKEIYTYRNTKRKLLRIIAAIWYNKTCREKHLSPRYISIKINGHSKQDINKLKAATHHRVNQEIKFLHAKKRG